MRALLAFLQATATSTNPVPTTPPKQIDLLALGPKPCATDDDVGDIVVCARRHANRLDPLPDKPGPPDLPPMTMRLPGGGTINLHAAETDLPGGHGSAAVVTLKMPF